jgi:hypothetical protein
MELSKLTRILVEIRRLLSTLFLPERIRSVKRGTAVSIYIYIYEMNGEEKNYRMEASRRWEYIIRMDMKGTVYEN